MGHGSMPIPLISQVSCDWTASGYWEFTYTWSGPSAAPSKVGFVVNAGSFADFANTFGTSTGSGTASNGYGDAAQPASTSTCGDGVISKGKHFIEVDTENGVAILKTETMSASGQSAGSSAAVNVGFGASASLDTRFIAVDMFPNYKPQTAGYTPITIPNLYHQGGHETQYLERIPTLSEPEPNSHGRHFVQKFIIGVPVTLYDDFFGGNQNPVPFTFTIGGTASITGTSSNPDYREWFAPGGNSVTLYAPIPGKLLWPMPSYNSPGEVEYIGDSDLLYIGRDNDGVLTNIEYPTLTTSDQIIDTTLKFEWHDGVQGIAEGTLLLRRCLVRDQDLGFWNEPSENWHDAMTWGDPGQQTFQEDQPPYFQWVEVAGSVIEFAATLGEAGVVATIVQPEVAVLAALLGVVGNVGQTVESEPVEVPRLSNKKIWPENWEDFYEPNIPPSFPQGDFSWKTQYSPTAQRQSYIYMISNLQGYSSQIPVTYTDPGKFMDGEQRTLEVMDGYPEAPPARWFYE